MLPVAVETVLFGSEIPTLKELLFGSSMATFAGTIMSCCRVQLNYFIIIKHQFSTSRIMLSGHNKWNNIRHIKAEKDDEKQRILCKMTTYLNGAVRSGGGSMDPKTNARLAKVLEMCKSNNVPKDFVDRHMERLKAKPVTTQFFDIRGPGGAVIVVETLTESSKRTEGQLSNYCKRATQNQYKLSSPNVRHIFEKKGVVNVSKSPKPNAENTKQPLTLPNLSQAENVAIEVGAEEVEASENDDGIDVFRFVCASSDLNAVSKAIANLGYEVTSAEVEYVAKERVQISDADSQLLQQLYEKLNEDADVNKVYDNVAYS